MKVADIVAVNPSARAAGRRSNALLSNVRRHLFRATDLLRGSNARRRLPRETYRGRGSRSAETAEPREKLLGRNAFFSVSLVEGGKKIGFLLGRESHNRFIASSEHGYGRPLRKRESLDDDLAANYGA